MEENGKRGRRPQDMKTGKQTTETRKERVVKMCLMILLTIPATQPDITSISVLFGCNKNFFFLVGGCISKYSHSLIIFQSPPFTVQDFQGALN